MTVIMFQGRFAPLVVAGTKTQTIRQPRKRPVKVGDRLSLRQWSGAAYRSPQVVLRETVCIGVGRIIIRDSGITRVNIFGSWEHVRYNFIDTFAIADGFSDWEDMANWFRKAHGLPFEGVLIRWQV